MARRSVRGNPVIVFLYAGVALLATFYMLCMGMACFGALGAVGLVGLAECPRCRRLTAVGWGGTAPGDCALCRHPGAAHPLRRVGRSVLVTWSFAMHLVHH